MKIFKYFLPILSLFLLGILIPNKTEAAEFHFKSYTLEQEEVVNDDVYAIGDSVIINGVVNGDLIVMADTIQINGTITGDLYTLGSKVDISSNVYGNTFILANNTTLEGTLNKNVYILGTFVSYDGNTPSDLFVLSLENTLKGSVGDDLRAISAKSIVDTVVSGDLILLGDDHTTSEEKISGNIYYNSTLENIAKEQGIDVDTEIEVDTPSFRETLGIRASMMFINFVSLCIVGWVIITLTPVKTIEIRKKITDSTDDFLKSLAYGFLFTILLPLPIFILFISIVGAPLAMFVIGFIAFIAMFGRIWVETAFGKEILELFGVKEYRPYKSFLVGRAISTGINLIPVVRGFYNSILVFVALGAIIRMKKYYYIEAKQQTKKGKKK